MDLTQAARQVLQDWSIGKIPYFTTPPERTGAEYAEASIVSSWAKDFNVEEVRTISISYTLINPFSVHSHSPTNHFSE